MNKKNTSIFFGLNDIHKNYELEKAKYHYSSQKSPLTELNNMFMDRNLNRSLSAPLLTQPEHYVQYYNKDSSLIKSLSKFISMGLANKDICIVIATMSHRKKLNNELIKNGIDILKEKNAGNYIVLDAQKTLNRFMIDGNLNTQLFYRTVANLLYALPKDSNIRIFGEMVTLLYRDRHRDAVLKLEELWNEVCKIRPFSLFCAYPMKLFNDAGQIKKFNDISLTHSRVIPTENYTSLNSSEEKLRKVALLQQKAIALENERGERMKVEKQRENLLNTTSHEFKTPLTSIKIFADLLHKQTRNYENEKVDHYINKIKDLATNLSNQVNDILDDSLIESGKLKLNIEEFSLNQLVKEIISDITSFSEKNEIILKESGETKLAADKYRITQVLMNLIINAIKYSPTRKNIIITIKKGDRNVIISIQDFGLGIKSLEQDKIFDRLYQSCNTKVNTYPGLGLGLYISKEIVNRHNGKIWVKSHIGKGSTFFFSLPFTSH